MFHESGVTPLSVAAGLIEDFAAGNLGKRIAQLERKWEGTTSQGAKRLAEDSAVGATVLASALELKRVAGQVNVIVHATGILTALPYLLKESENIESLSLGAGNTGRDFDLVTNLRIAEFKFIKWRGADTIRQNSAFKDFYNLAEAATEKRRFLYLTGTEHAMKFFDGGRALESVMSRNRRLADDFDSKFGKRFRTVSEYYQHRKSQVEIVDLILDVPGFKELFG